MTTGRPGEEAKHLLCPGCGDPITPRYQPLGVCRNCYGTMDDPAQRWANTLNRPTTGDDRDDHGGGA